MSWKFMTILVLWSISATGGHPYTRTRREAADNPSGGLCSIDRYRCDGGKKCIPLKWICDDVTDCDDKRDERNCIPTNQNATVSGLSQNDIENAHKMLSGSPIQAGKSCATDKFSCDSDSKCLGMSSLCDTVRDCQDGSDEKNCPIKSNASACKANKFSCDNGAKCLPLTWLCDSISDCIDKRDEHNCPATIPGATLARAAQDAAVTAAQEAKRAALKAQDLMKTAELAAAKAKIAMEIAEANEG